MSVTPGPWATPSSSRNGRSGRGARVEHRVEVADQQDAGAAGLAVEGRHDRVAELPGRIRPVLDAAPRSARNSPVQRPTSLTPAGV